MSASSEFTALTPQVEAAAILEQLREDSVVPFMMGTAGAGVALVLFGDELYDLAWQGSVIGLTLMCLALLAFWLRGRSVAACYWVMICGWVGAIALSATWLPGWPVVVLLTLPFLVSLLFMGWKGGLFMALAILVGLGVLTAAGRDNLAPRDFWLVASALLGIVAVIWLALRSLQQTVYWLVQNYRSGRLELEAARDRQGEMGQLLRDLADANAQMVRLNQLLTTARQQAEEAERVKAEFVANVSHELRTPLNMVLGYCEMIMNVPAAYGEKLPPRLLADIGAIQRNSQHLTGLINDVLDISQIEARRMILNKEWIELPQILREANLAVQPLLESRNLYLKVSVVDELPLLYCDRTRIRQVVLNLLSNAARFTEVGGIEVVAQIEEENVKVTVTDTGPGIAEADLPKLFQPFRQLDGSTRRKQGGSGLGLNISRNFIELHGGKMGVQSQQGAGSSFWFTLPIFLPNPSQSGFGRWLSAEYDRIRHPATAIRQRILPRFLVLEQEEYLAGFARQYEKDIETVSASQPAEAVEMNRETPAQVVLIRGETDEQAHTWAGQLYDLDMATPLMVCATSHQPPGRTLGVEDYLLKPVRHQQLLDAIQAVPAPVKSILLVDDDPEALQLFARLLSARPHRYRILQADNGKEALNLMRSRKVDLVILDLIMPGMDGYAVLQEKQSDAAIREIPTIILTADDPERQPHWVPDVSIRRPGGFSFQEVCQMALKISETLEGSPRGLSQERPAVDPA